MKRILTTLIFIGICTLNAQTPTNYYLDSMINFTFNNGKIDTLKEVYSSNVWNLGKVYGVNKISYLKNKGLWVPFEKYFSTDSTDSVFFWNIEAEQWKPKFLTTNHYNADSTVKTSISAIYDAKKDTLVNTSKVISRVDSLGSIVLEQNISWDTVTNDWSSTYNYCEYVIKDYIRLESFCIEFNGLFTKTETKMDYLDNLNQINFKFNQDLHTWEERSIKNIGVSLQPKIRTENISEYYYDDSNKRMVGSIKHIIVKDSIQNIVSDTQSQWDTTSNDWKLGLTIVYYYDSAWKYYTRMSQYVQYLKGSQIVDSIVHDEIYYREFNSLGSILLDSTYDNLRHIGIQMTVNTYNTANQILLSTYSRWDYEKSTWLYLMKYENNYDAKGNQLSGYSYSWDQNTNSWLNTQIREGKYDQDNLFVSWAKYTYDFDLKIMKKVSLDEDKYKNQRVIYSVSFRGSNDSLNVWVPIYKRELAYNEEGLLTRGEIYLWDTTSNKYLPANEELNSYDTFGNQMYRKISYASEGALRFISEWFNYFSYHDLVTNLGAEDWTQDSFVYPNPTKDYLNLSQIPAEQYQILDMSGTVVQEGNVPDFQKILDLRNLCSGTYLLKLIHKNNIVSKAFVKI